MALMFLFPHPPFQCKLPDRDKDVSGSALSLLPVCTTADTTVYQFLHGDPQALLLNWLDFLAHVLEQTQGACAKRSRDGWICCSGPSSCCSSPSWEKGQWGHRHWLLPIVISEQFMYVWCSAKCHDPGMQLLLRHLPAGRSNCRCVTFYLFIYVNQVQSLKRLSHAMQGM